MSRLECAQLRDGDLVVAQQFQQKSLKFFVRPVQLVNQQHRRPVASLVDGFQQGPLDQKLLTEQVNAGIVAVHVAATSLHQTNFQQLTSVVPLVHGVVYVQALVALQAYQVGLQPRCQRAGDLRFPDSGLALQKQRSLQFQRQKDGDGQPPVGDVCLVAQQVLHCLHGIRNRRARVRNSVVGRGNRHWATPGSGFRQLKPL